MSKKKYTLQSFWICQIDAKEQVGKKSMMLSNDAEQCWKWKGKSTGNVTPFYNFWNFCKTFYVKTATINKLVSTVVKHLLTI